MSVVESEKLIKLFLLDKEIEWALRIVGNGGSKEMEHQAVDDVTVKGEK